MNDIFAAIYIMGALQGLFLSAVLAVRRENLFSNRILALLLSLFSINLIVLFCMEMGYFRQFPHLVLSTTSFSFLYGPLIYFYVAALTSDIEDFRKKDLLHFVPFAIYMVKLIPFYLQSGAEKLAFYDDFLQHGTRHDIYQTVIYGAKSLQYLVYMALALLLLKRYARQIEEFFSEIEERKLVWLRLVIAFNLVTLSAMTISYVLYVTGIHGLDKNTTRISFFLTIVWIYSIGYFAMRQPEIFTQSRAMRRVLEGPEPENEKPTEQKYGKSGISTAMLDEFKRRLLLYMEEKKPYRDSTFTLQQVADALNISYHHLSQVLNGGLNKNFYSFVNEYRVAEVKRLLSEAEPDKSVLFLAFEAGFNSKSNFNNIFKKVTGQTPSEYRRSLVPADRQGHAPE